MPEHDHRFDSVQALNVGTRCLLSATLGGVEQLGAAIVQHAVDHQRVSLWIGDRALRYRDGYPIFDVVAAAAGTEGLRGYLQHIYDNSTSHDEDERLGSVVPFDDLGSETSIAITLA